MKKLFILLTVCALCLMIFSASADGAGATVTVYGAGGTESRTDGIVCTAGTSVHCYSGPSVSYDYLGTWDADGNTVFRALTLTYDSRNEPWALTEIREGSISRVYGYVKLSELGLSDPGLLVREAGLYDLLYMQCVEMTPNVTCRTGPGKEFSSSPARIGSLQGTILLTANGFALVETWTDNASPSRVWVRTSDLYY